MDVKQNNQQQQIFRGVEMRHEGDTNHTSTDITDLSQMSLASGTSTESIDIILSQQHPPICIQVQTEVELVPLTWDEVSTTLSPDARSKCWAGQ
ncbi:hypothetical protein Agabi119p4_8837 [Agaricus bisporus var. burnettii]|uniref:Uncharacterized protein n=1 Tax=Agaricus bisporus var. burnettii TaxID=192524 RepID=A0A8H7C654_AGABI|nr:hypothetical protein Agabi119p4_8837 [Agaricus bisporus var. burnettii]